MKTIRILILAASVAGSVLMPFGTLAQASGIHRTDVVRHDLSIPGRETLQVRVDFPPGTSFGHHTHPGEEIAYVIEGTLEYRLAGRPPVRLEAGQALFIPAGAVHSAKNVGAGNAAKLATYIVEKDKPLVTLAH